MDLPFDWEQGQHLSIIGQTGTGKSYLASALLTTRRYVVIFQTAPDPATKYQVDLRTKHAKDLNKAGYDRILLRPDYDNRAEEFRDALRMCDKAGGWTVYLDELLHMDRLVYFTQDGLRRVKHSVREDYEKLLTEGRKKHISVAAGMQRPVQVSRFMLGESRHVLSFGLEGRDAKEFRDATNQTAWQVVQDLDVEHHEFVWVYKPRGVWRGRLKDGELTGEYVRR